MATPARFTPAFLKQVQHDLTAACADVATKHGLDIHFGRGTYGDTFFTFKLEGSIPGQDKDAARLRTHAELFGAKAEWLGKQFHGRADTKAITVVGMTANGCLLVKDAQGHRMRYKASATSRWDKIMVPVEAVAA